MRYLWAALGMIARLFTVAAWMLLLLIVFVIDATTAQVTVQ